MPGLFDPFTLRDVTFRNRIGVAPMCMYSAEDGRANDWHLVHDGGFAKGGAGLVIVEATAVLPEGRITPGDLGLWRDEQIEPLARVARFIEAQGAVPAIQLAHAGRKASTARPWEGGGAAGPELGGWSPIYSASALPFDDASQVPEPLGVGGIRDVVAAFGRAAGRAREAGFRVVEIHAAHGYLLHQFLSPLSNRRTDDYGGSFENRTRLLREVTEAVRGEWPERSPLFVRFSCSEWTEGGFDVEEAAAAARLLRPLGLDLADCSSGGNVAGARVPAAPGFQVRFAEEVRLRAEIPTAAVGLITEPEQAEAIVRSGKADLILLARELLRDPHFALRAAHALGVEGPWPKQYVRGKWPPAPRLR